MQSTWSTDTPMARESPKAQILPLNVILHQKELGLLGGMADFRVRSGRAQEEPKIACARN